MRFITALVFVLAAAFAAPASAQGDSAARLAYQTGNNYHDGTNGVSKNWLTAMQWYQQAGDYVPALIALGDMWDDYGQGSKSVPYYERAANLGSVAAMSRLGYIYASYLGLPDHTGNAMTWYTKAAAHGDTYAMVGLGLIYNSSSMGQQTNTACEWFKKAADKGDYAGMNNVGICYENGTGVKRNLKLAAQLFQRAETKARAAGDDNLANMAADNLSAMQNPNQGYGDNGPSSAAGDEVKRERQLRDTQDMINANRIIQQNMNGN